MRETTTRRPRRAPRMQQHLGEIIISPVVELVDQLQGSVSHGQRTCVVRRARNLVADEPAERGGGHDGRDVRQRADRLEVVVLPCHHVQRVDALTEAAVDLMQRAAEKTDGFTRQSQVGTTAGPPQEITRLVAERPSPRR
jgi:hypothetical protein